MKRDIRLTAISPDYFACCVCKSFVGDPLECRGCESLFCSNCAQQDKPCHFCFNSITPVGAWFSKVLRQIVVKCKHPGCNTEEPIHLIARHEQICRYGVPLRRESEILTIQRDALIDIIRSITPSHASCPTPQSFQFNF